MTEADLGCLKSKSRSAGHCYLDYDPKDEKLSIIFSHDKDKLLNGQSNGATLSYNGNSHETRETLQHDQFENNIFIDISNAREPVSFQRLNPNDVYGSFIFSEEQGRNIDAQDTPAAKERLNNNKQSSEDDDEFVSCDLKSNPNSNNLLDLGGSTEGVYKFTHPLKEVGLQEEGCVEPSYANMFFMKKDIKNIEVIRLRAYFEYYHELGNLYEDMMSMLKYTLAHRCKNACAKYYISEIIHCVQSLFKDTNRIETFRRLYKEDFDYKFEQNNFLKISGTWNKTIGPPREFKQIDRYYPVIDREETLKKLKTTKTSQCSGDC